MSQDWTCPHCGRDQSVTNNKIHTSHVPIKIAGLAEGDITACFIAIGCASPKCRKITLNLAVRPDNGRRGEFDFKIDYVAQPLFNKRLLPVSAAKPQPDYIPAALVEDYYEAALIAADSPKAAATLARRCIQGMIRHYCGIKKGTLGGEIDALKAAVESGKAPDGVTIATVDAIDHVRSIGAIGAHMEKDIDLIIPVEEDEAHALIQLIEMLFEEWYVASKTRQDKFARIASIGTAKKEIRDSGRAAKAANNALAAPEGDASPPALPAPLTKGDQAEQAD